MEFSRQTPEYSSRPQQQIFRPVLQLSPRLCDWLNLEIRGELPYLLEEKQGGHGISIGVKAHSGEKWSCGIAWLNYQLPGGQANWSGEGVKAEANYRF